MKIFQDHYLKIKTSKEFSNAADSSIYFLLPDDRLVTEEEIHRLCRQNKDAPQATRVIDNTITKLEDEGLLKKIIGVHLERFAQRFGKN